MSPDKDPAAVSQQAIEKRRGREGEMSKRITAECPSCGTELAVENWPAPFRKHLDLCPNPLQKNSAWEQAESDAEFREERGVR